MHIRYERKMKEALMKERLDECPAAIGIDRNEAAESSASNEYAR
jgi:hypothetical protein